MNVVIFSFQLIKVNITLLFLFRKEENCLFTLIMNLINTHEWKYEFCFEINVFNHHIMLFLSFHTEVYATLGCFIKHLHSTYYVLGSTNINLILMTVLRQRLLYSFL